MKIQVDLNEQLWIDFKSKVQGEGKTLREVVPTLFEPALRAYLDPPPEPKSISEEIEEKVQPLSEDINKKIGVPPSIVNSPSDKAYTELAETFKEIAKPLPIKLPTVKRCELCDMPVDRLFHSEGRRVCYSCWKGELTKDREPVNSIDPSEGPSPSSVSSPS